MATVAPLARWSRSNKLCVLALCAGALGCTNDETIVRLLKPPVASGDAGTAGASGVGGAAGSAGASGSAGDGGTVAGQLIHRYSFTGTGTQVIDSIAGADGMILGGATLDGAGHMPLDGADDYASLPGGLISGLTSASIVGWLNWAGGPCWQRLFDFGNTDAGVELQGNAVTELFFTPLRCPGSGPALDYSMPTYSNAVDSNTPFPVDGRYVPISILFDGAAGQMALYVDGVLLGTNALQPLSAIQDETAWLGRSLWPQDINLHGIYDELRIYDYALSDSERIAIEAAGPDVLP